MPIDASRAAGRTTHLPRPAISSEPLRLHPVAQAVSGAICALMLYMALPQAASAQSSVAPAAQTGLLRFDIPAGPLAAALRSLASTANLLLTFTEEQTRGKATAGIEGQYTSQEALAAVLAGTGLQAVALDGGGYVLRAVPAGLVGEATPREGVPATLAPVRVTGRAERPSDLPEAYAGGQVARGARLGLLGNTDIMDAPFGIASYTARTIENQQLQGRSVADLVSRNDPSVRVYGGDGADTDTLRIRGFNVAIADAAFDGLPGLLSYQRSGTEFAERVEVLRGPNAMLNGMAPGGSVGGALNVVPKRAGDVPLTRLTASYLSDSRFGLHADLGRRFGTDNEWGIRINGALGKGETARDSQDQKHALGSIALDYRSQRLRASIDYVNQNLRDTGNSTPLLYVGTIGVVPAPPDGSTNLSQPWSEVRNGNRMLTSRVEFDITPDLTVHAMLGRAKGWSNGKSSNANFLTSTAGDTTSSPAHNHFRQETTSGEIGATGRLSTGTLKHQWSLAMAMLKRDFDLGFGATTTPLASNLYHPTYYPEPPGMQLPTATRYSRSRLSSLGIADTLSFADDRVRLTLGIRHQTVKMDSFNLSTGQVSSRYDKSASTPFAGLVVKPWQGGAIYVNAIEGLAQGSMAPDTATNRGETLPPYKTKQYEAGVKQEWNGFGGSVSLFQIAQRSGMVNPANNRFDDAGEQRHRGLELNAFGELARGVRLLSGAAWVDAEMTSTASTLIIGKRPIGIPRFTANLSGEWDVPAVAGLTLTGGLVHTGSSYVDAGNTIQISSWTRTDLGARWAARMGNQPIVFRASIENAFDRRYWAATSYGNLVLGMPRTVALSATVDF